MFEKLARVPIESEKSAIKAEISALKSRLTIQQQQIKQAKLPVVVLIEGWGAAGKGSLISDIVPSTCFPSIRPRKKKAAIPFCGGISRKSPRRGSSCFLIPAGMAKRCKIA